MSESGVAYEAVGVSVSLGGTPVLHGIDLRVQAGEVLALVGPNGAGKSTLLSALTGDVAVTGGRVELWGRELGCWQTGELARQRSVLLQSNQVSFGFRVRAVVEMGRAPWLGTARAAGDAAAVTEALRRTDALHLAERPYPQLSGGEKARVSLARVLAQDTPVVLLDEPTAALDLLHTEAVMGVARELAAQGRAVVVVLHDLSLAAAYADVIGIIDQGRLVAAGPPAEVLRPELLAEVYGVAVQVFTGPDGQLIIQPRRAAGPGAGRSQ